MTTKLARWCLLAFALCSSAAAQIAGPGLTWSGSSGAAAGGFFPSCAINRVTASAGETVTISVWGDRLSGYGLFLSASASRCVTFPGIGGGLMLDGPIVPIAAGTLSQWPPCRACPESVEEFVITLPSGTPAGLALSLQAIGFGIGAPSFTSAIAVTVR